MLSGWTRLSRDAVRKRLPILSWLSKYSVDDCAGDIVAGITVGLTLLPQAIAYAALAGLSPQYGLYSSIAGSMVYIVFGTTKQINIGPTSLLSLLTFTYTNGTNPDVAVLFCFLSGCIELIFGVLNLGFLVSFVSLPVVSGFTSAAALTIASAQLKGLFGLHYESEGFVTSLVQHQKHFGETRLWDLALGIACIVVLLLLRMLKDVNTKEVSGCQKIVNTTLWYMSTGRNALVVVACALLAYACEVNNARPFILTGHIESGLPRISLPPTSTTISGQPVDFLAMLKLLGSGLIVCPVIAVLSNIAIAKAFSQGVVMDGSQEMIALGMCNIIGSFLSSIPVCGAFSRSAVNNASGVRTPLGGLYTACLVVLTLSFLTPYFYFIPKTTLAAVIITAVLFMIEGHVIMPMWRANKLDLIPGVATFVVALLRGIEFGLLVGIVVDILVLLCYNARPGTRIEKVDNLSGVDYWMVTPLSGLLYPAIDSVRTLVIEQAGTKEVEAGRKGTVIVLNCANITRVDFSSIQGIHGMIEDVRKRGAEMILFNAQANVLNALSAVIKDVTHAPTQQILNQLIHDVIRVNSPSRELT